MGSPLIISGYSNQFTLAGITPFTYRDGETYLEQIKRMRIWFDEMFTILAANVTAVSAEDSAANAALAASLNEQLVDFVNLWTTELIAIQDQSPTFVFDPTNGTRTETINIALSRIYDNLRYYAFFADQLDGFEYTAAEWDAMQYTARGFDLNLAYNSNVTQAVDHVPATVVPFIS